MRARPPRTLAAVLARVEHLAEMRHRAYVDSVSQPRFACERHGWSPEGGRPTTMNWTAIGSLCPICRSERREAKRKAEAPEVVTLEHRLPPFAEQAWKESLLLRERAGFVTAGSTLEREMLRTINEQRLVEEIELAETADDRRRANAEHWARRLGVRTHSQRYLRHPARAGP